MRSARETTGIARGLVLVWVFAALASCDDTRRDWRTCYMNDCGEGYVCTIDHRCVRVDAGGFDGGALDAVPSILPDSSVDGGWDATGIDIPSRFDGGVEVLSGGGTLDAGSVDVLDVAGENGIDVAIDTRIPDVAETCVIDLDCPSTSQPYCLQGRCAVCKTGDQCQGNAPICSASHACVSCAVTDGGCPFATPACEADSGRCVECLRDGDCTRDAKKSFCAGGTCVGCAGAGSNACVERDRSKPACLANGTCAECSGSRDCTVATKPICDAATATCMPCTRDDQCAARSSGPGVCMFHQDGHCTTDAETVYVGSSGTCSDTVSDAGSAQTPFCTAQVGVEAAMSQGKPVVMMMGALNGGFTGIGLTAPLTVVGKNAVITPTGFSDGISVIKGELYLRRLIITGSAALQTAIGIKASPSSGNAVVLHMDSCAVINNPGGGILLNGAAFDISNTTVIGNGPNTAAWGGIQVQNPPPNGPTTLHLVTINDNKQVGLTCNSSIAMNNTGIGVLAIGNTGGIDISSTCEVKACTVVSTICGAQSTP
jgi:hypothetical protein